MTTAPLAWEKMPFGSKRVDVEDGTDPVGWGRDLAASLDVWRQDGTVAVWIQCPMAASPCIAEAATLGFTFHHAEGDTAMLSLWLSAKTENKIPPYATHTIGVGGFVLNERQEVLVVKELASGAAAQWKLPGGLGDLGEDLGETASREVFEETGVQTEFESLVAFRHQHGSAFGRSNIYFVARLKPVGSTEIHMDAAELSACEWMPLQAYIDMHANAGYGMNGEVAQWVADQETGVATSKIDFLQLEGPNTARGRGGRLYHVAKI